MLTVAARPPADTRPAGRLTAGDVDLSVTIGRLTLANPVMPASGTFAEGLAGVFDFDRLGAVVTKTVTAALRDGNPTPRVAEITAGMLNAIGIPSKGTARFLAEVLPFYRRVASPLVVSVSAPTVEGFAEIAAAVAVPGVAAVEANISCPNLEADGKAFAGDAASAAAVTARIRRATDLPIWVKLSPNTGDVAAVARAVEDAGADALVVANTVLAMAIDTATFRPRLGNVMGGLSGPAVKPIILRMTWQCAQAVSIPVIGCGGIATADDAVEYMLAGAAAVQVGTATFVHPTAMIDVIDGLTSFCADKGLRRVASLTGAARHGLSPADLVEMSP